MFKYTACPRPLCRVLVARSLVIAIALLIELAMAGQGHAECPLFIWPPGGCTAGHKMEPRSILTNLHDLVNEYINQYKLNHTINRAENEIMQLDDNKKLAMDRKCTPTTYETCLCRGHNVCFPVPPPGCAYGGHVFKDGERNKSLEKCNGITGKWYRPRSRHRRGHRTR
jgi:hypothetical protein